jgi:hypothetical protein
MYSKQCRLTKGNKVQYSWIPTKFAIKNKKLILKNENGDWEQWIVDEVYSTVSHKSLKFLEEQHKKTREASDI